MAVGLVGGRPAVAAAQNAGFFLIPTGPAVGTTVTSGTANAYGSYAQLIASTSAALFIAGLVLDTPPAIAGITYFQFMVATGGAGAESGIGEAKTGFIEDASIGHFDSLLLFPFPLRVAASTRIAVKSACTQSGKTFNVSLLCINQTNLVIFT